jgi:DNA (cytosine-5)-methyltransferase 1
MVKLASLFSGCGGLDLGFEQAGYEVIWANDYDKRVHDTYRANFPGTPIDGRSIVDIPASDVPDIDGLIGSPPCQSWSEAGAKRGISDPRGRLFFEYIRLIEAKQPKFFVAENVSGLLHARNVEAFSYISSLFRDLGYRLSCKLIDCSDYGVPQTRERVFIVGIRDDLDLEFEFPEPLESKQSMRDAISDMGEPVSLRRRASESDEERLLPNHEYTIGDFSPHYMSRQRVRDWDHQSFTIQATGRHIPLHPQASPMIKAGKDEFVFDPDTVAPYRRLSVRECARIQTFPDTFQFVYDVVDLGYMMIGNAVPPLASQRIAEKLHKELFNVV